MPRTLFGKSRTAEKPYAIYRAGDWEWRILKTYKHHDAERDDQYARWFCAVKSPHTFGCFEMGDTYAVEVARFGNLHEATTEWLAAYPDHVKLNVDVIE